MGYKNNEDQVACAKRYYEANKEMLKKKAQVRNTITRKRNRQYIRDVKSQSHCVDCGEKNPIVLDFDHVRGDKTGAIADMVNQCYCIESLQIEIEKCEVRCANCHRIVTHARRAEKKIKSNAKTNSKGAT